MEQSNNLHNSYVGHSLYIVGSVGYVHQQNHAPNCKRDTSAGVESPSENADSLFGEATASVLNRRRLGGRTAADEKTWLLDVVVLTCLQFPVCRSQRMGPFSRALFLGHALQNPLPTGCLPLICSCATLHHQRPSPSLRRPGTSSASSASIARHGKAEPQRQVPHQHDGLLHVPAVHSVNSKTAGAPPRGHAQGNKNRRHRRQDRSVGALHKAEQCVTVTDTHCHYLLLLHSRRQVREGVRRSKRGRDAQLPPYIER